MKHLFLVCMLLIPISVSAFETNYSTSLKFVASIGYWEYKNKKGYFRFISHSIGSEHAISKLFVQWVTYHIDGEAESKIINEKEITELRGYEYSVPVCNKKNNCKNFILEATESFGNFRNAVFTIEIPKFSEYLIEKKALQQNVQPDK